MRALVLLTSDNTGWTAGIGEHRGLAINQSVSGTAPKQTQAPPAQPNPADSKTARGAHTQSNTIIITYGKSYIPMKRASFHGQSNGECIAYCKVGHHGVNPNCRTPHHNIRKKDQTKASRKTLLYDTAEPQYMLYFERNTCCTSDLQTVVVVVSLHRPEELHRDMPTNTAPRQHPNTPTPPWAALPPIPTHMSSSRPRYTRSLSRSTNTTPCGRLSLLVSRRYRAWIPTRNGTGACLVVGFERAPKQGKGSGGRGGGSIVVEQAATIPSVSKVSH